MRIRHIRDKLILASLVVVLPLIVLVIVNQVERLKESRHEAAGVERDSALDVSDILMTYDHGLVAMSLAIGNRWFTGGIYSRDLASAVSSINRSGRTISHLCLINLDGRIVASSTPSLIGLDQSGNNAVRAVRNGAVWSVADAGICPVDRSVVTGTVAGIRAPGGPLQAMLMASVDEKDLRTALRYQRGRSERVVITDARGVVVMMSSGSELTWNQRHWGSRPYIREALSGREAHVDQMTMPDGLVMTGVVQPVSEIGWTVGVFDPRVEVIGPIQRESAIRLLMVVALTILVLGLVIHLGNKLSEPVLHLAASVHQFGEGKLDARANVKTGDEVEYLADRFNDMARVLQFRQSQLRESLDAQTQQSRHVETLYRTAEGIIVTTSLKDKLQIVAKSLSEMAGVKRCVILLRQGNSMVGATGWGLPNPEVVESFNVRISELDPDLAKAVEERKPVMVPEEGEGRVLPDHLRGFHVARTLVLPITHAERLVGLAVLDSPGELTTFRGQSVNDALQLTELAAVAIENAQLYEREKRIAEVLQRGLLPSIPHEVGRLRLATGYYPALEFAEVGGDFYDYVQLPDGRISLVIADISGKGLEAAVYTAMGKYTMRAFVIENPSPSDVFTRTNDALVKSSREWGFITAFLGVADPETCVLAYGNAGHPPAVLVRANGETSCIPCPEQQPPLGILEDITYVEQSLKLEPGDMLIGYTDGLIEARAAGGEMFEIERLCQLASRNRHIQPEDLVDIIYASACEFSEGHLSDDIAILIVKAR